MRGEIGLTPRRFICPSPAICRSLVCLLFVLVAGSSTGISDEAEVEHILNVLKITPRCRGAGQSKYNGPDLNRMDVHVKVEIDGVWTSIRRSGSAVFDTKLKMAREVRRRVEEIIGKAVVDLAEEQMMSAEESVCAPAQDPTAAAPPPTEEELEWLASWLDAQPDPSEITHAQAEAALLQRREQQAGAATSARLMEMQVLLAKERAAELRLERAQRELVKARAAIPQVEPQPKRARSAEPRPYEKWSDPLGEFIREEGMLWTRRRVELSADKAARPPEKMPRGKDAEGNERGPLRHWRRGLVFALQDWAEGSKADAAKLVFDLIEELELEVRLPLPCRTLCSTPLCVLSAGPFRGLSV